MRYLVFNPLKSFMTNSYLVWDEETANAVIIDPAAPSQEIINKVKELKLSVKFVINTHGHADHIGGNKYFSEKLNIPILVHEKDAEMLTDPRKNLSAHMDEDAFVSPKATQLLQDGDSIKFGEIEMSVIHTPGHTQGSISLYARPYLFSGDTLFEESVGRTDLPGGSQEQIIDSIVSKIFELPDQTKVLPGHGDATSIEDEKIGNPYVGLISKI